MLVVTKSRSLRHNLQGRSRVTMIKVHVSLLNLLRLFIAPAAKTKTITVQPGEVLGAQRCTMINKR